MNVGRLPLPRKAPPMTTVRIEKEVSDSLECKKRYPSETKGDVIKRIIQNNTPRQLQDIRISDLEESVERHFKISEERKTALWACEDTLKGFSPIIHLIGRPSAFPVYWILL